MKNFAQVDAENLVTQVVVVSDEKDADWLSSRLGGIWIETSDEMTFNRASKGYTYHPSKNGFIPIKKFQSWELNENTLKWEAPVPEPEDGENYSWDESNLIWIKD